MSALPDVIDPTVNGAESGFEQRRMLTTPVVAGHAHRGGLHQVGTREKEEAALFPSWECIPPHGF